MNPEVFMWLALLAFALVAIVLVGWTIVHLGAPRGDDDLAPRRRGLITSSGDPHR